MPGVARNSRDGTSSPPTAATLVIDIGKYLRPSASLSRNFVSVRPSAHFDREPPTNFVELRRKNSHLRADVSLDAGRCSYKRGVR